MKCHWCGQTILDVEPWEVIDLMLLHSSNNNRIRVNSCKQAYKFYCQFIKNGGAVKDIPEYLQ